MEMDAPHTQVLPFYPQYDTSQPSPLAVEDYTNPANCCGHTQRSWLTYYCIKAFLESGGGISADLGSAGVQMLSAISIDYIGNGETPQYGGVMNGVHIKRDACDLSIFGDGSLSAVVSNHFLEHPFCAQLKPSEREDINHKIDLACSGTEILHLFRDQWLRVIRPGGYFCAVFPEEGAAQRGGHSVFHQDPSHQHAWYASNFRWDIIQPLIDEGLVDLVEFDTFQNNFSCNVTLRKK